MAKKPNPVEGSDEEEAMESESFEKKEDSKQKKSTRKSAPVDETISQHKRMAMGEKIKG